jgi:peptide deformylase
MTIPAFKTIFPTLMLLASLLAFSCDHEKGGFTNEEMELIHSGDSTEMFRVLQTDNASDSIVLRKISRDVRPGKKDETLSLLIDRMYASMRDSLRPGVGIAAPQVGINRNVIWVQRFDKEGEPFEVYLNPEILKYSRLTRKGYEGCLSIPDCREEVCRSYTIMVRYQKLNGLKKTEMVEGFTAVIFQHEVDHLKGILFTDRLEEEQEGVDLASVETCDAEGA